jgi:hypothetical protein
VLKRASMRPYSASFKLTQVAVLLGLAGQHLWHSLQVGARKVDFLEDEAGTKTLNAKSLGAQRRLKCAGAKYPAVWRV